MHAGGRSALRHRPSVRRLVGAACPRILVQLSRPDLYIIYISAMQAVAGTSGLAARVGASQPVARLPSSRHMAVGTATACSSAVPGAGLSTAAAAQPRRAVAAAAGPTSGGAERDYKVALITGANTGGCCLLKLIACRTRICSLQQRACRRSRPEALAGTQRQLTDHRLRVRAQASAFRRRWRCCAKTIAWCWAAGTRPRQRRRARGSSASALRWGLARAGESPGRTPSPPASCTGPSPPTCPAVPAPPLLPQGAGSGRHGGHRAGLNRPC